MFFFEFFGPKKKEVPHPLVNGIYTTTDSFQPWPLGLLISQVLNYMEISSRLQKCELNKNAVAVWIRNRSNSKLLLLAYTTDWVNSKEWFHLCSTIAAQDFFEYHRRLLPRSCILDYRDFIWRRRRLLWLFLLIINLLFWRGYHSYRWIGWIFRIRWKSKHGPQDPFNSSSFRCINV